MGIFGITGADCNDFPFALYTLVCDIIIRPITSIFSYSILSPFTPLAPLLPLSAANFWHDPSNEASYNFTWLAEVNSNKYGKYLAKLDNAIFIEFLQDEIVIPHESEVF